METVCEKNKCTGCMACVDICPKKAIAIQDKMSEYNAVIEEEECIHCGACHRICQINSNPETRVPIAWYQGWAENMNIRRNSSSGGFAASISRAFIKDGGVVYSCCFKRGEFRFSRATETQEIDKFVGSKYVKSNPQGVYAAIKTDLKSDRKVLFIGLPCQAAALKNYVGEKHCNGLYIADLICHGTPSPKLLNIFLHQYNTSLESMSSIIFRVKAKMQLHGDSKGIITKGVSDRYTIAFLNGLTYTENCYECRYARRERVSDITLGDSWGSCMTADKRKDGISLALCQTQKGVDLLEKAEVALFDVDLETAISHNQQLDHPFKMPDCRQAFFEAIANGKRFNKEVQKCFPKQCFRQDVKELLIRMNIIRGGE